MSENLPADSAPASDATTHVESPPVAAQPPRDEGPDPRVKLLQLAGELMRSHNRRLVIEYLRLRRSIA
ncbi:MAG: hypothetical protein QOF78_1923 [Phycisphaerales bacterium]|jgi:hypothetical protein|nr:hypothetical protein [Phycisphaerales bacterium]